ncbi:MAG TPA: hypothetical protein VF092_25990 [Longimicrobium sp.]
MQPIRISRVVEFQPALVPDSQAVLRGIETELIWRGNSTLRMTPDEYVFRGPGVARALLPSGGSTTWLVRGGRISTVGTRTELRVELELDPVSLFLVPLAAAAVLMLLPMDTAERAIGMLSGAILWGFAATHAWRRYSEWISRSARRPWFT